MIEFISFSSGSCGNCYYIGDGKKGLLIDAGVSARTIRPVLAERGLSFDSFSAILVTHDHLDHIRGLLSFCRMARKPVYATAKLHAALATHSFTKDCIASYRKFLGESVTEIDGFKVRHFEVPHDATQTLGYQIEIDGYRFFIMTDVGRVTDEAVALARECSTVVIESNYDVDMLWGGPYPAELKMRICSGNGHISNDECAEALKRIWHPSLDHIYLCHLSENNNTPQAAYRASSAALAEAMGVAVEELDRLVCLPRTRPSQTFILKQD